jgi:hypothetical protein
VTLSAFDRECDRLSHVVDDVQFERLRWARTEGPMLARLIELTQASVEQRSDFDLVEENASRDEKRFVLKIHGNRIAVITIGLSNGAAVMQVEAAERSKYAVLPGAPVSADFGCVDAPWIATALQQLFARIQLA